MRLLLAILFTLSAAHAGLERVTVKNLNFDYEKPFGKGDVEKIGIGFSTKAQGPYPVEIVRTDEALELTSPVIDITWNKPWGFVHDLEVLTVEKTSVLLGKKEHSATINRARFAPKDGSVFILKNIAGVCKGSSEDSQIENRLMDDCREGLKLTVESLDVPMNFFMAQLVSELPEQEPMKLEERPLDSLILTSQNGDFALSVYTRIVFYAGLRAWGHLSYEEGRSAVLIRIDQVKFGYLPITPIVMRELKKRLKHPSVTITGNTIRISLKP